MKLEETETFKLQYVNNIQATTSQTSFIHVSDTELLEKITQISNIKIQFLKVNHHSRNDVIIAADME